MRPPRAHVLALGALGITALAACSPEIAPGAYLCGPDQACPDGLACDGVEDVCVLPSQVRPFACGRDRTEVEPNDDPAMAPSSGQLACVSTLAEVAGCLPADDGADHYAIEVPAICTAVAVQARIAFPIAHEVLALELVADDASVVGSSAPCPNVDLDDANVEHCLTAGVTPGARYTLRVRHGDAVACGGTCAYNRYLLTFQLATP